MLNDKVNKKIFSFKPRNSGFASSTVCMIMFSFCFVLIYSLLNLYTNWYMLKISEIKELGNLFTYDLRSDIFASVYEGEHAIKAFNEDIIINGNRLFFKDDEIFIEKGEKND